MLTRREMIMGTLAFATLPQILRAQEHAAQAARAGAAGDLVPFEYLDGAAAATLAALAAEIIPSDDGPGATEAGAVYFIDRALATFDAEKRGQYTEGLQQIDALRTRLFPISPSIDALTREQRREIVRGIERTEFFETLRTHVVLGFLANPEYGGNRGHAGWTYIAFEDRMAFEPPFGYYDAHKDEVPR